MDRTHNRITAADITVGILTVLAFIGATYCVLDALGSL